jgi:hypothetical protein
MSFLLTSRLYWLMGEAGLKEMAHDENHQQYDEADQQERKFPWRIQQVKTATTSAIFFM